MITQLQFTSPNYQASDCVYFKSGYTLGPEKDRGGQGIIYEGWDNFGNEIIFKEAEKCLLEAEEATLGCIWNEFNNSAKNVIRPLGLHECDGITYLALEKLGETITNSGLIGNMTPYTLIKLSLHILNGILEAAKTGIAIIDLKPCNIMISIEGIRAVLIDFASATPFGMKCSSFSEYFSPPEAQNGTARKTSDVFSFGRTTEITLTDFFDVGPEHRVTSVIPWVSYPIAEIIRRCCNPHYFHRPHLEEVINTFKSEKKKMWICDCGAWQFKNCRLPYSCCVKTGNFSS